MVLNDRNFVQELSGVVEVTSGQPHVVGYLLAGHAALPEHRFGTSLRRIEVLSCAPATVVAEILVVGRPFVEPGVELSSERVCKAAYDLFRPFPGPAEFNDDMGQRNECGP